MNTRILTLLALFMLLDAGSAVSAAERRLVLIANSQSSISALAPTEVRKLYLGVALQHNGKTLKPIRNDSDSLAQEVFLQKVLFMSERVYERQVLSKVFRMGGNRPDVYTDRDKLLSGVRNDPGAITYAWEDSVSNQAGVKIIGVLWQGDI